MKSIEKGSYVKVIDHGPSPGKVGEIVLISPRGPFGVLYKIKYCNDFDGPYNFYDDEIRLLSKEELRLLFTEQVIDS